MGWRNRPAATFVKLNTDKCEVQPLGRKIHLQQYRLGAARQQSCSTGKPGDPNGLGGQ